MRRGLPAEIQPGHQAGLEPAVASLQRTVFYVPTTLTDYGVHVRDEADGERGEKWRSFIRDITTRPGWTVRRLADESGLNRSTIFRWKNGTTKNLTLDSVRLVAEAAGVDLGTALRAASDLVASTPARNADELSEDIQKVLDDAGLPDDDRLTIAQMLLDEFDRDEEDRKRQRVERARTTIETWKRARGA